MIQKTIKSTLVQKLLEITPAIDTVYEAVSPPYTPIANTPYQEVNFIPAINEEQYVNEYDYKAKGIFQVTLKYPDGVGNGAISDRADLIVDKFRYGKNFSGVKIMNTPMVKNMGSDGVNTIYVVSINYSYFVEVL